MVLGMITFIPPIDDVRRQLGPLTMRQLAVLEALSGVPATTIYKIKLGTTANPGTETVRQFLPHIDAAKTFSCVEDIKAA
jgi:hypothetical protein